MKLPWVSRALYEAKLEQIEDLKAANADLIKIALSKDAMPPKSDEVEEYASRPHRPLVKELVQRAEREMRERAMASGKAK